MEKAGYRKLNDRTVASSTYHKKDGTAVRAKLKEETKRQVSLMGVGGLGEVVSGATLVDEGEQNA